MVINSNFNIIKIKKFAKQEINVYKASEDNIVELLLSND